MQINLFIVIVGKAVLVSSLNFYRQTDPQVPSLKEYFRNTLDVGHFKLYRLYEEEKTDIS